MSALPGPSCPGTCHQSRNKSNILDLCVSSLREGHANLLCIISILTDVAEATRVLAEACTFPLLLLVLFPLLFLPTC